MSGPPPPSPSRPAPAPKQARSRLRIKEGRLVSRPLLSVEPNLPYLLLFFRRPHRLDVLHLRMYLLHFFLGSAPLVDARGISMCISVYSLIIVSTEITPPCRRTMSLDIAKPRPVPFSGGLVVKKGLNIFSFTSSGIPIPLSRSVTRIFSSSRRVFNRERRHIALLLALLRKVLTAKIRGITCVSHHVQEHAAKFLRNHLHCGRYPNRSPLPSSRLKSASAARWL